MGTLIDRFEEHEGSVRSVDFHPTQPLFVSGGDDYTVRVWSLDTRKCLFTLTGHLDYVRTVYFHHDLPWIISASDDQTIRIWNWQNRQEIACLTGHNHYVMSAQFHPSEDLIVSASLDQTVRVWDISGLRQKHSAPQNNYYEDQFNRQQIPQQDIFGNTDAVVKYILEGHDRGVNWASFHPRLPLIVSGSDDRQVKLWRMSETKAWEVDTCRGHSNNVLSVLFHPTQDLIISVAEDKTIRVWDLNKRTPVKQFKRENDRFWLVASHPNINLFAACHDSGVMVFKLDRERPANAVYQNQLYYINNEKQVQLFDYDKKVSSMPMLSLKKIGNTWNNLRSLSYNPSSRSIIVTTGDQYALVGLPKDVTGAIDPTDLKLGEANNAVFIARNRFVTYTKSTQTLDVKDLDNTTTKSIKLDGNVKDVVYGGPGTVLLLKNNAVVHYDAQQKKVLAEASVSNVKYVTWSLDGQYLALLSKHTITIVNKKLEVITSMHETIRIKSAAWEDSGVLFYSTLNHIKYTLLNGDNGIIKTLDNTLYITKVIGRDVFTLNRNGEVEIVKIDSTEYRFKKALVNKKFYEVLRLIKTSKLVGQNIIAYLQKSGYPEVALQFVQDPQTKFELALECGNLEVAKAEAITLNNIQIWEKLGKEALRQGNTELVEMAYQNQRQFDKLSFLYLINGSADKLAKMQTIAEHRGDVSSLIQNTIYNNSTEKRAQVFAQAGSLPLAYATAKVNGHDELAATILEQAGLTEDDVELPEVEPVSTPEPVKSVTTWSLAPAELSYFEKAILGQLEDLEIADDGADLEEDRAASADAGNSFADEALFEDEEMGEDDGGWDFGDDDAEEDEEEEEELFEIDESAIPTGELAHWVRNSKVAAGYVAAGAFDTAAQLLNRQVGAVNFEPLRSRFLQVYESSKLTLSGSEELPPLQTYVRADLEEDDVKKVLPFLPGFDEISKAMNEGFSFFKGNKLEDAVAAFRKVIYIIAVIAVDNDEDETKAREALKLAREYILGISIELARRSLGPEDVQRNLELAAYFTKCEMLPQHRANALQVAADQAFKNKNFASAGYFASEFLKIIGSGPRAEKVKKIKTKSDTIARDAIEINFDQDAVFDICPSTYTPIYKGTPSVSEALTGAKYHTSEKGKLDKITLVTSIGAPASGLRIHV
ncbi:Coatomer subunit alpha [Cyberlindnera fabianii]|nr:Coatomer subunit alpha [Cyberlindnera fabianii]